MSDSEILPGGAPPPPPNSWNPTSVTGNPPGTPVYASSGGHVSKAKANAAGTALCVGLQLQQSDAGRQTPVRYAGLVVLTEAEWDVIVGGSTGLTPGAAYFVSKDTAGLLVTTRPLTPNYVAPVGIALSATALLVLLSAKVDVGAGS